MAGVEDLGCAGPPACVPTASPCPCGEGGHRQCAGQAGLCVQRGPGWVGAGLAHWPVGRPLHLLKSAASSKGMADLCPQPPPGGDLQAPGASYLPGGLGHTSGSNNTRYNGDFHTLHLLPAGGLESEVGRACSPSKHWGHHHGSGSHPPLQPARLHTRGHIMLPGGVSCPHACEGAVGGSLWVGLLQTPPLHLSSPGPTPASSHCPDPALAPPASAEAATSSSCQREQHHHHGKQDGFHGVLLLTHST